MLGFNKHLVILATFSQCVFAAHLAGAQEAPLYEPNTETHEYAENLSDTVENVRRDMAAARELDGHIYLQGGYYDGAAAGQSVEMVVTPDDKVLCAFAIAPLMESDVASLDAYRFIQVDIYRQLATILLPNITTLDNYEVEKFALETQENGRATWSKLTWGDPRFEAFTEFVFLNRNPCWTFG